MGKGVITVDRFLDCVCVCCVGGNVHAVKVYTVQGRGRVGWRS